MEQNQTKRDWSAIMWNLDGSMNELMREFGGDPENVYNCDVCPWKKTHSGHDQLPCGQYHCWVELSCCPAITNESNEL